MSVRGAVGVACAASCATSGFAPLRRGREEWKNWERKDWNRNLDAGFAELKPERAVFAEKYDKFMGRWMVDLTVRMGWAVKKERIAAAFAAVRGRADVPATPRIVAIEEAIELERILQPRELRVRGENMSLSRPSFSA